MEKLTVRYGHPVYCLDCYRTTLFNAELPSGWIAETWRTESDDTIEVVLCFPCRHQRVECRYEQIQQAVCATGTEE